MIGAKQTTTSIEFTFSLYALPRKETMLEKHTALPTGKDR